VKRQWAALALAMMLPSAMAYWYFVVLASNDGGQANAALQVAYPTAKVVQFCLPIVFVVFAGSVGLADSTHRTPRQTGGIRLGVAFGCATATLIIVTAQVLRDSVLIDVPNRVAHKVAEFGTATPLRFLGLAIFLSVVHSLFEEYYWRWFVHVRLRQWLAFTPAAALSSIAFAGHHLFVLDYYLPGRFWSAAVPFTLAIAVGGAFWAWLYERSGSLIGPWLSHLIVDAAIMAVGYKMLFLP
jgi:membrane protease YdiL (CAAX protease family)